MTASDSNAKDDSDGHEQPKRGNREPPTRVEIKARRAEWAENWFAGTTSCPVCGGDDMNIVRTHGEGSFLIEKWRCASSGCPGRWRIEWRESAAGVDDDAETLEADWYERETEILQFQILVEDGIVTGVRTAPGGTTPDPFPQFVVHQYNKQRLDPGDITAIDEAGRAYAEHEVSKIPNHGGGDQCVCSLLVASTAHVTAEEAQSLTDHGYARGEYGFFFYAAGDPSAMLSELGAFSAGLRGIIREAQHRNCSYVLLDRDGPTLPGVSTYLW